MSLRGLFVLVVLLALALTLYYWAGRAPATTGGEGKGLGTVLAGPRDGIGAIEIESAGQRVRLERRGEKQWAIVSPIAADADPREVESFLEGLGNAKLLRVVEEKAKDLAPFGLGQGATAIRIEGGKGTAAQVVRIGRRSPVGAERYTELGDSRVLLADFGGILLERAPESFRERRLFPVEAESIRRIAITRTAGRLVLARRERVWSLAEPIRDLADYGGADGLARNVAGLSLGRYLPDREAASAAPRDGRGAIRIEIETERGPLAAEIGPPGPDGERRAKRVGGAGVGVVTENDVAEVLRPSEDFREHRPLLFSSPDVKGFRVEGGGATLHAFLDEKLGAWWVGEGTGPVVRAETARIDETVDRIRWLRASRLADAPSASFVEALRIELEGEGGPVGRIELDRVPPAAAPIGAGRRGEETLRVRSSQRPGCLFEIPVAQLEGIPRLRADLTGPGAERKP